MSSLNKPKGHQLTENLRAKGFPAPSCPTYAAVIPGREVQQHQGEIPNQTALHPLGLHGPVVAIQRLIIIHVHRQMVWASLPARTVLTNVPGVAPAGILLVGSVSPAYMAVVTTVLSAHPLAAPCSPEGTPAAAPSLPSDVALRPFARRRAIPSALLCDAGSHPSRVEDRPNTREQERSPCPAKPVPWRCSHFLWSYRRS